MDASASPADPGPAPSAAEPGGDAPAPAPGHGPVVPTAPVPLSRLRRLAPPVGAMAAVVAAFGYVATVDPNEPGHYPVCPMLRFTGLLCPGCGGLRSAHAFAHGDLVAALGSNAPAVLGYVAFAAVWLLWMVRAGRGQPLRIGLAPAYLWGLGAVLLVFTVVRNLPFGSGLAP
ncbi:MULTISPECIES: DUF2752 domain-containing protein [Streptomyces]|uniref:DUF2752 domain-containing protein n=1 Tax=Streptomyces clavifer TaxID=68188 RepID=A0ABS4VE58_9ACTN|nr:MULTISPECIES: DUF2752 domain-containing protein [Streptomyces]MBP2361914.1 hypothetical protein [Streptomyces clavifer]MDX2746390.1 DUF2752 domain-containing protein [Streptomyces sp. NRRL_B-2557]